MPTKPLSGLSLLVFLPMLMLGPVMQAQAQEGTQDYAWVDAFPTPEELDGKIRGADEADTLARQRATIDILQEIMMAKRPNLVDPPSPEWSAKYKAYTEANNKIWAQAKKLSMPWEEWFELQSDYRYDDDFETDITAMLVPAETGVLAEQDERWRAARNAKQGGESTGDSGWNGQAMFFGCIVAALFFAFINKLVWKSAVPFRTDDGTWFMTKWSDGSTSTSFSGTERGNATGAALVVIFFYSAIGFSGDFFEATGSSSTGRLFSLLSIPALAAAVFFAWRAIKYLIVASVLLFLVWQSFMFVTGGTAATVWGWG